MLKKRVMWKADEQKRKLSSNSAVPLSSTEHFNVFQFIVLVLQPATGSVSWFVF